MWQVRESTTTFWTPATTRVEIIRAVRAFQQWLHLPCLPQRHGKYLLYSKTQPDPIVVSRTLQTPSWKWAEAFRSNSQFGSTVTLNPAGRWAHIVAVQAVPVCTADKWGVITCLNTHKSVNSPASALEEWGYRTDVFKQVMHGSQEIFEIPSYRLCLATWYCPGQQRQT